MIVVATLARLVLVLFGVSNDAVGASTFSWFDAIAAGMLLSLVLGGRPLAIAPAARWALIVAGLAVWALSARYLPQTAPMALLRYPSLVVGSVLLILGTLGNAAVSVRALVYLGRISYGLYVFHVLAILVASYFVARHSFTLYLLVAFSLTVLLATLSYRYLELPFLRLKRRFTKVGSAPELDFRSTGVAFASPAPDERTSAADPVLLQ